MHGALLVRDMLCRPQQYQCSKQACHTRLALHSFKAQLGATLLCRQQQRCVYRAHTAQSCLMVASASLCCMRNSADMADCLPLFMQMTSQLGSPEAALRVVATAVCAAGSKSCTHVHVLLERYSHLLQQLIQAVGQEQGESLLLEVLGHMYSQMPTRLHLALSR